MQNAGIVFQSNVKEDVAKDKETYEKVPEGLSNNKTSPGVLICQATLLENPVSFDMDCLTDITPLTFPHYNNNTGIMAANELNFGKLVLLFYIVSLKKTRYRVCQKIAQDDLCSN